jgi:hypothetical protein
MTVFCVCSLVSQERYAGVTKVTKKSLREKLKMHRALCDFVADIVTCKKKVSG